MNNPNKDKPSKQDTTVKNCAIVFIVIGIVVYQAVAPKLFPTLPGGGFNWERSLGAGVVGAVCAVLGAAVGKLLSSMRQ